MYAQEVDIGDTSYIPSDDELASLLTTITNPNAVVGPLIQTKWHQGSPFNNMLPMNGNSRPLTGCGVLAAIQIMKFHNHPIRGSGQTEQYSIRIGIQEPVNINIAYDWSNMLNSYRSDGRNSNELQRNAVATLAYHVGVAWKRDFIGRSYRSRDLPIVLTTYFGYDRSIQLIERVFYDDTAWEALIKQQLDLGLPVYYRGYHPGSDHSFIVDGYDSTGRFHINWGWGGSRDGWYFLNNLNPRGNRSWYNDHHIIINIKPDAGGTSATNEMASGYGIVIENFSPEKTSVLRNERFSLTLRPRNRGGNPFSGQVGAALIDNNGNIVAVIGTRNISLRVGNQLTTTFNCTVPNTVRPGQYNLRIVVRPNENENWRIVTLSLDGVPNSIEFNVR
jgi:hypothetical protein